MKRGACSAIACLAPENLFSMPTEVFAPRQRVSTGGFAERTLTETQKLIVEFSVPVEPGGDEDSEVVGNTYRAPVEGLVV